MQIEESNIYRNLKKLRHMLFHEHIRMTNAHKILFGDILVKASGECLEEFILAFTFKEEKVAHMDKCIGKFGVLRTDLEFAIKEGILKLPKAKRTSANETDAELINNRKIELLRLLGKIDEECIKYRGSLARVRSTTDKPQ